MQAHRRVQQLKRTIGTIKNSLDPFHKTIFGSEARLNFCACIVVAVHIALLCTYGTLVSDQLVDIFNITFSCFYIVETCGRVWVIIQGKKQVDGAPKAYTLGEVQEWGVHNRNSMFDVLVHGINN